MTTPRLASPQRSPSLVQFLVQVAPIFGYLLYHKFGQDSLSRTFAPGMSHEQALVTLGLMLPWFTQIAVITTCQNNGYPGRADTFREDVLGILRSLMFFSLPILTVLMAAAVVQLSWPIEIAAKFGAFLLLNIMMSITFVILSIHHLWLWWFAGSILYIVLLVALPWTLFAAPLGTLAYGLFAIRVARILPFKLQVMSELDAGIFGLCLGSILWLDKIFWWLKGLALIHSGSIFLLLIPGVLLAAVYFAFFAHAINDRVDILYASSSVLSAAAYFALVAKMRRYFLDVTLILFAIALLLFAIVVGLMELSEVEYGIKHFVWLTTILFQALALVFALILSTVLNKEAVVRVAQYFGLALAVAFLVLEDALILPAQLTISGLLMVTFWAECRRSFTHPIELAFVQNIHNSQ